MIVYIPSATRRKRDFENSGYLDKFSQGIKIIRETNQAISKRKCEEKGEIIKPIKRSSKTSVKTAQMPQKTAQKYKLKQPKPYQKSTLNSPRSAQPFVQNARFSRFNQYNVNVLSVDQRENIAKNTATRQGEFIELAKKNSAANINYTNISTKVNSFNPYEVAVNHRKKASSQSTLANEFSMLESFSERNNLPKKFREQG